MSRPYEPDAPSHRPDWKEAAADFVSARVELFALEAKDAAKGGVQKAVCAGIAAVCAVLVWLCVVAGLIGWITALSGWAWYFITLLAGAFHLLVAVIAVAILKRPAAAGGAFPLTRNELAKDREWLRTLQAPHPPKR